MLHLLWLYKLPELRHNWVMCDKIAPLLIYEKVVLLSPASGALGLRNDAISCLISHNTAGHTVQLVKSTSVASTNLRHIMFMWQWNGLIDWLIIYGMALKNLEHMPPNNMDQSHSGDVTDEHFMAMMKTVKDTLWKNYKRLSYILYSPATIILNISSTKVNASTPTLYCMENWL